MDRLPSTRFALGALFLMAVMEATNPAFAQNINDLLTIFGGDRQRAVRQAKTEWHRLPPAEVACIDQRLRNKGSSIDALVRRGVKPSAARLIKLRSSCREFVESVQTGTAPALARDATGPPMPTLLPSDPTEPKNAGVTPSPAQSPKDAGATPPSSAESVGRVAEDQVQRGNVELKDSLRESGIMVWLPAAFLLAVLATVALLGIVIYLFIRWRNTGQRTVAVSLPEKDSEGGLEKAPFESAIGRRGEVVAPLADKIIPDQTGRHEAFSTSQNSAYSTGLLESSKSIITDHSVVDSVCQLAKLYAMGTPSEKEFQRLKGLISHSIADSQEPEFR